jgi:hypothetical protein
MNPVIFIIVFFIFVTGTQLSAVPDTESVADAEVSTEATGERAPVESAESIYAYDEKDLPEVFFFPKEKARWDGSKVTMSEWYMLTELQKEKFIIEYFNQLQGQYNTTIDVMGTDYLKALNVFSAYSNERVMNEPSTNFIDILLSGQGKMSPKGQEPGGSQK